MDPLKSVWLVIHVFVASLSTAFLALAFGLSVMQLLQARRERLAVVAAENGGGPERSFLRTLPSAEALEGLAYRLAIIGFILWTFTLIAGAIWAQDAWGRYWGFDVKEVWTFIIWVLYARLHPCSRDPRLARHPLRLARDRGLRRRDLRLHDREHVLRRTPRLLGIVETRALTRGIQEDPRLL